MVGNSRSRIVIFNSEPFLYPSRQGATFMFVGFVFQDLRNGGSKGIFTKRIPLDPLTHWKPLDQCVHQKYSVRQICDIKYSNSHNR